MTAAGDDRGRRPCRTRARLIVEIPHFVETLHRAETFPPHSMFYFRATKSFHDNRRQSAHRRAGLGRTAPGRTMLLGFHSTAPTARRCHAAADRAPR
jgi:hypothetical protein